MSYLTHPEKTSGEFKQPHTHILVSILVRTLLQIMHCLAPNLNHYYWMPYPNPQPKPNSNWDTETKTNPQKGQTKHTCEHATSHQDTQFKSVNHSHINLSYLFSEAPCSVLKSHINKKNLIDWTFWHGDDVWSSNSVSTSSLSRVTFSLSLRLSEPPAWSLCQQRGMNSSVMVINSSKDLERSTDFWKISRS